MEEEGTKYLARLAADRAELAIVGRASYLNCVNLSKFLNDVATKTRGEIIVDCENCTGMDSTVLGILAGTAIKIRKTGGRMVLTNLSERNMELVQNLGLDKLMSASKDGERLPIFDYKLSKGAAKSSDILSAHESLIEANSSNEDKFRDVVRFLRASNEDDKSN